MSNFEYSEMRKKLNKAHSEIIHSRQYRGARESDVVSWLADYVENNFIATSAYQALQKENEELKKERDRYANAMKIALQEGIFFNKKTVLNRITEIFTKD